MAFTNMRRCVMCLSIRILHAIQVVPMKARRKRVSAQCSWAICLTDGNPFQI